MTVMLTVRDGKIWRETDYFAAPVRCAGLVTTVIHSRSER